MKPVTGQIRVKTKYRECDLAQRNLILHRASIAVQKILFVENTKSVTVEMWKGKPGGKITFIFDITFLSDGEHESEPVMFTDGPVYDSFERAVHKVLGAQKPAVKTYTATLRIRKDDNPEIHSLPFSTSFPAIQEVQAQVRERVLQGKSAFESFIKAVIADAALTPARTTGMPPCMAAPYGRTKTVNGHEVPRGITLDELNAMVQGGNSLTCEIWYVAPWAAQMVHHTRGVSTALCRSAELGTAHLTRDAAVRHAMALFIPEKLEKPEDERTDIYESARDALMRDHVVNMKRIAAIRISNLRRNIKLDNDALKIVAPDGKTIIVNGHLVQRGITRAEYDAMPVKPADLWLVRISVHGGMVFRSSWLSEMTAQHMDLGLAHLDREDAECHARALFTPDELDVAGGATNA